MEHILRTELTTIWALFTSMRKTSLGEANRNNFFASCFKNLLIKKSVCLEDFVLMCKIPATERMGVFISAHGPRSACSCWQTVWRGRQLGS